jgi:hypothetical protein
MMPVEAFALLRERHIEEIAKGRGVAELTTLELTECLRLHGCRIPRFEGDAYDATMEVYDWIGMTEGDAVLSAFLEKSDGVVVVEHQTIGGC